MCPLSATLQLFIILVGLLLVCHHAVAQLQEWKLLVSPENPVITMHKTETFQFNIEGPPDEEMNSILYLKLESQSDHIASPDKKEILIKTQALNKKYNTGSFNITGNFLGETKVLLRLVKKAAVKPLVSLELPVKVIREKRVIDTVFTSSVATLVSIIYINFGCALKWGELRTNLRRPVGPAIGVVTQFLLMPLLSFGLGYLLFPDNPEMQLGMFFTGVSPGGGASNVWVAVLDGNIDLSITMTTVSTFGAFAMMPFWLFTLGSVIFDKGEITIPYKSISTYAVALVVPLLIGFLLQRYLKKVARFFVRILKVFSSLLILFIVIFAIVTNLYIFELFSWQIVVAGMGLPWLGYMLAYALARVCKQSSKDSLTIAIETGIQNTGIAIFLLRFSLPQPEADITTVVPVSVATMTPIPLLLLFIYKKIRERCAQNKEKTSLLHYQKDADLENNTEMEDKNVNTQNITTVS